MDLMSGHLGQLRMKLDLALDAFQRNVKDSWWVAKVVEILTLMRMEREATNELIKLGDQFEARAKEFKELYDKKQIEFQRVVEENKRHKEYLSSNRSMDERERDSWRSTVTRARADAEAAQTERDDARRVVEARGKRIQELDRAIAKKNEQIIAMERRLKSQRQVIREEMERSRVVKNERDSLVETITKINEIVKPNSVAQLPEKIRNLQIDANAERARQDTERRRAAGELVDMEWDNARGFVEAGASKNLPVKTLECSACHEKKEFTSPQQAKDLGWFADVDGKIFCRKESRFSYKLSSQIRAITLEDFGWQVGVDARSASYCEVPACWKRPTRCENHRDAKIFLGANGKMVVENLNQVSEPHTNAFKATANPAPDLKVELKNAAGDYVAPTEKFKGSRSFDEAADMFASGAPEGAEITLDPCACSVQDLRLVGIYRARGEGIRCNKCLRYLSPAKTHLIAKILFRTDVKKTSP